MACGIPDPAFRGQAKTLFLNSKTIVSLVPAASEDCCSSCRILSHGSRTSGSSRDPAKMGGIPRNTDTRFYTPIFRLESKCYLRLLGRHALPSFCWASSAKGSMGPEAQKQQTSNARSCATTVQRILAQPMASYLFTPCWGP